MEPKNTYKIKEEILLAQQRQYNSMTKKTLWDTEVISQDEAAFLLDISKETLRDRSMIFKPYRMGNKFYYLPKTLKEAIINQALQKTSICTDIETEFEKLTKPKRNEYKNPKGSK